MRDTAIEMARPNKDMEGYQSLLEYRPPSDMYVETY